MSSPSKRMENASPSAEPENGQQLPKASQSKLKLTACAACKKKKKRCMHVDASADPGISAAASPAIIAEASRQSAAQDQSPSPNKKRKLDAPSPKKDISPVLKTTEGAFPTVEAIVETPAVALVSGVDDANASSKEPPINTSMSKVANGTAVDSNTTTAGKAKSDEKASKANGTHKASTVKQPANGSPFTQTNVPDKSIWQGWCEIESEPANFNLMLKEYGVKGVRVKEVWSLDGLDDLPQPVYGAVLLFRYRDVGVEDDTEACPDNLWFSNQTAENACATTALLNLILNVPEVDLGEPLTQFKDFTKDFTPFLRGQEIANFQFVKKIHNSFAKKADILNVDLCMKNNYDARNKATKKRKASKMAADDDVPYHFVAFVPVEGSVWRLDGLDHEPSRIGAVSEIGWLSLAGEKIGAIMAAGLDGVDEIGYTLLAVVRDPVEELRQALAANMAAIEELGAEAGAAEKRTALEAERLGLQSTIQEEEREVRDEEAKVKERRHDYVPLVGAWLRMLAEKGALKEVLEGEA